MQIFHFHESGDAQVVLCGGSAGGVAALPINVTHMLSVPLLVGRVLSTGPCSS